MASSSKTSLEGSAPKGYSISDTIQVKEQEKIEALGAEGSTEKKAPTATKEALSKQRKYIIRHASRGKLTTEQIVEVQDYSEDLNYPSGSLVYGGNDEDDYLYQTTAGLKFAVK